MPPTLFTTPNRGLRYPSAANSGSDFAAGIADLAVDLDTPRVSALPTVGPSGSGPLIDGQECYFAPGTTGEVWHLRYSAASASTYKWEFIGGSPTYTDTGAGVASTGAGTPANVAQNFGPTHGIPLAGDYMVRHGSLIATTDTPNYAVYVSAYGSDGQGYAQELGVVTLYQAATLAVAQRRTLTAGSVIQRAITIDTASKACQVRDAWVEVTPVRVG